MKNTLTLMFLLTILTMFVACKKKEIVKDILPAAGNPNGQRIDAENMEDAMNTFITLTREDNVDECSDYEARDALLIMEAALNYHTGTPAEQYDEIVPDTFNFQMNLVWDEKNSEFIFSTGQMESVWPEVLAAIASANTRVSFDDPNDPFNIVVDLEFLEFDPESQQEEQVAEVRVITLVGNIPYPIPWPSCTWDTTDYWYGFLQTVSHGCNTNSNTTSNCFKEMQKRLHINCRGTCEACYYSNITIHNPPNWPWYPGCIECPPNNTYLYYSDTLVGQVCFSPSELECYTNGVKQASSFFSDRCLIATQLFEMYPGCPCPQFHHAEFVYGDPHLCN
jgi:hypothetical protein